MRTHGKKYRKAAEKRNIESSYAPKQALEIVKGNAYAKFEWFMGSLIGRLILFGYTWALLHHTLGGIRHLIWDTGRGMGPNEREWLAAATLIGSIAFTVMLWIVGLLAMGGPR